MSCSSSPSPLLSFCPLFPLIIILSLPLGSDPKSNNDNDFSPKWPNCLTPGLPLSYKTQHKATGEHFFFCCRTLYPHCGDEADEFHLSLTEGCVSQDLSSKVAPVKRSLSAGI